MILSKKKILLSPQPRFAGKYDGASYLSRINPINCDLNGPEIISATDDKTFETTVGNWVGIGTTSILRSTVAHHSGVASGLIAGVGDGTSNYAKLPSANLGAIVVGNKYTLEIWNQDVTNATILHIKIGSQSFTSSAELTSAFGKVVFNFLATASEVGADLIVWMTTATGGYIDDVSLTQAFDGMGIVFFNTSNAATMNLVGTGQEGNSGFELYPRATQVSCEINDGTNRSISTQNKMVVDGRWHLLAGTIVRDGNVTPYVDGLPLTAVSCVSTGKCLAAGFTVGAETNAGTKFTGYAAETQFIRFSTLPANIASIIAQISATKHCLPSYPNGQVVFWNNPKYGMRDLSGNGNNLSVGAGSVPIVRI